VNGVTSGGSEGTIMLPVKWPAMLLAARFEE
jgi:hypothetical protein